MQGMFKLTIFYFLLNTNSFLIYSLMIMFPFTPPSKNKRIHILESSWDFTGLPNQRKTKRGRCPKKQLTQRLRLICPVLCPVLRPVLQQHQRELVHQIQATMQGHDVDEMSEQSQPLLCSFFCYFDYDRTNHSLCWETDNTYVFHRWQICILFFIFGSSYSSVT